MATNRHKNARFVSAFATAIGAGNVTTSITTTSTAAAANHFSCSRSSPFDRANLTTSAVTPTARAASTQRIGVNVTTTPPIRLEEVANGWAQRRVAVTNVAAVATVKAPPTNQAAGRHRGERSCPSGKSRNAKASMARGIGQIQLDTHMAARPPGSDPGAMSSACSP
jgi:hypothetical protein